MKRVVEERQTPFANADVNRGAPLLASKPIAICAGIYILCLLISLAPLYRLAGARMLHLPTNSLLTIWGSWLPVDLHLTADRHASMVTTHTILFLLCFGLAFAVYGLAAWWLHRQPEGGDYRRITRVIWLGVIIAGCIFVIAPVTLSHDIFAYAAYGRILAVYHTNPYFIPFTAFPQDAFSPYDDWQHIPSAYGPVWEVISGLAVKIIGNHLDRALLVFRVLALIPHLLNALLVALILRKMGHSERTIALGTLLYAWNPLVLEESSLGGHNDALMITLILLGILFSVYTEQKKVSGPPRLKEYAPPVVAFALASLIKFSALPVLAVYLILLARKSLAGSAGERKQQLGAQALAVLRTVVPAGLIGLAVILGLYAPYWVGYRLQDIIYTFSATPSNASSYGSMLFAMIKWVQANDYPPTSSWTYPIVYIFTEHRTWSYISLAAIVIMLIVGVRWIWRTPTARTLVLSMVAMLGLILVITYWFFPWYLTWTVGLGVLCLPTRNRFERALIAFTLVFSASSLCFYLYASNLPPLGGWSWWSCLSTLGPPLVTFVVFMLLPFWQERDAQKVDTLA